MEQSVSCTLYPKKIIIVTRIGDEYGSTWTETDCLSILPVDVPDSELGVVILRHLKLSVIREIPIDELWNMRERALALTKFKTYGQKMKHAKQVTIKLNGSNMNFQPWNNRYSEVRRRLYELLRMNEATFEIDYPCEPEHIGANIRKAWQLAIIT